MPSGFESLHRRDFIRSSGIAAFNAFTVPRPDQGHALTTHRPGKPGESGMR